MKQIVFSLMFILSMSTFVCGQYALSDDDLERELDQVKSELTNIEKEIANATTMEGKIALVRKLYGNVELPDIKEQLAKNLQGHPFESILKQNPKLFDFVARLLKDDLALSRLSEIAKLRNHLIAFAVFILITFFIKRKIRKKYSNYYFTTRFMVALSSFVFFFIVRFGMFYLMFQEQLQPSINLFRVSFNL